MKKLFIFFACFLIAFNSFAQKDSNKTEMPIVLETTTGKIYGSLVLPLNPQKQIPVVLIIAGSGPTDRDCNQPTLKTDAFKLLANQLAKHQIASVRYDKRGIGASKESFTGEANLRFDNYINDAADW